MLTFVVLCACVYVCVRLFPSLQAALEDEPRPASAAVRPDRGGGERGKSGRGSAAGSSGGSDVGGSPAPAQGEVHTLSKQIGDHRRGPEQIIERRFFYQIRRRLPLGTWRRYSRHLLYLSWCWKRLKYNVSAYICRRPESCRESQSRDLSRRRCSVCQLVR